MNNQRNPTISKGVDSTLIWLYLLLVAIGLLSIFSVTYHDGDDVLRSFLNFKTDYSKQLIYFFVSILIGLFILLTDSKFFTATANFLPDAPADHLYRYRTEQTVLFYLS